MAPRVYPAFEIQADRTALEALAGKLIGIAVEFGPRAPGSVWLRDEQGQSWSVFACDHQLEFKFEVFGLKILTQDALQRWVKGWAPPIPVEELPEEVRLAIQARPRVVPEPCFEPWPFKDWTVSVLRRVEWIGPVDSFSPVARGRTPPDAEATCETTVGFLFCDDEGRRLLIAVADMPLDLVVTQEREVIDSYMVDCEAVPLAAYVEQLHAAASAERGPRNEGEVQEG